MPRVYDQLLQIRSKLEKHYKEMQDIEFTVQDGTLYMLQTRTGKRNGHRGGPDGRRDGQGRADRRDDGDQAGQPRKPQPPAPAAARPQGQEEAGRQGHRRQPGAASGKVVLSAEAAVAHHAASPRRTDPAGAQGDQPGGRRGHAPGQGDLHGDRRQGQPRRGRRPRLGKALRRRLRRPADRREAAADHDRRQRWSRPAITSRSTARPATS